MQGSRIWLVQSPTSEDPLKRKVVFLMEKWGYWNTRAGNKPGDVGNGKGATWMGVRC